MYKNKLKCIWRTLRKDLKDVKFNIDFMPLYDLKTRKVTGADALVKLEAPKAFFYHKEYITLLERLKLSKHFDYYVLKKVCHCLKIWKLTNHKLIPITVYQSKQTFFNCNYIDTLHEIVSDFQVHTYLITLELSIETILQDIDFSKNVLEKLKEMGFRIAIADSGISEFYLELLSEISFDELTFNISYIKGLSTENKRQAILTRNVKILNQNACDIIYKGIDTESNEKFLKAFGSKTGQGLYFSKPIPFTHFDEVVKEFGFYPSN